jgi:hypothetical protein
VHAISTNECDGVITSTFTGDVRIEERCEAIDQVVDAAQTHHLTKLLLDFSNARLYSESTDSWRRLADRLAHNEVLARCQIAYVTPRFRHFDLAIDVLARGKGFIAEKFDSREAALRWLCH